MTKQLLLAALTGAFATLACAQSASTGTSSAPAAQAGTNAASPNIAPMTPADQRAADLQSAMEIRKWQAGPTSGDQAANIPNSTDSMAPAEKRAADLNAQMEIRGWQAGPSAGDQASRIDAGASQTPIPTLRFDTPEAQRAMEHESTQ